MYSLCIINFQPVNGEENPNDSDTSTSEKEDASEKEFHDEKKYTDFTEEEKTPPKLTP